MSDYLFSVIIPAYNAEPYIGEAIESALNQKGVSIEVIVVDDGSSDRTADIARGFGKHVRVVTQSNSGSSSARNHGAAVASGNILAFLDADDIWLAEKLKHQNHKLKEGYKMVYTNRFNFGDIGDLPEVQTDVFYMPEGDIFEYILLVGNVITNSSVVIQKETFHSLGGFSSGLYFCEDWDMWLRVAAYHEIGFCKEPLVKYRIHSSTKSRNYRAKYEARNKIISDILKTERGSRLSNTLRRKIWAQTYSATAWEAARAKDLRMALKCYGKAIWAWPLDFGAWYNVARAVTGRI